MQKAAQERLRGEVTMVKGPPSDSCCKHFCTCCLIKIVCQNTKKYVKAMILTEYGLHLIHNHIYSRPLPWGTLH